MMGAGEKILTAERAEVAEKCEKRSLYFLCVLPVLWGSSS